MPSASPDTWEPPSTVSSEEIVRASEAMLGRSDIALDTREEVFRVQVLGLDWDIGGKVYVPRDPVYIPTGADGKKIGALLLHGGGGDHRGMEPLALLLAGKLGWKVATMTYPGHLYFDDPSHEWPGGTVNPDGTARTPIWKIGEAITPDQYEVVQDRSDPVLRAKYGTILFLKAKEGTAFYERMAAWPMAFEEALKEVCRRNFPESEFSVYAHGHSTGGPFIHMLLQRVSNIVGLIGMESSPYGAIFGKMLNQGWKFPFTYIMVRTWRDIARYAGPEAGPDGMRRLPWLMEEVFAEWDRRKSSPGLKAQHIVQFAAVDEIEAAARASAKRLGMSAVETTALVERFRGYPGPLSGEGVKPVPPLLYGLASGSRDHTLERYRDVLLPALAAISPPPKARIVQFGAGVHGYMKAEEGLPKGIGPAIAKLWSDAIAGNYYTSQDMEGITSR